MIEIKRKKESNVFVIFYVKSGSLNLSGKPSDGSSYWPVYGFVIKS
jgi:hypothetical protein